MKLKYIEAEARPAPITPLTTKRMEYEDGGWRVHSMNGYLFVAAPRSFLRSDGPPMSRAELSEAMDHLQIIIDELAQEARARG